MMLENIRKIIQEAADDCCTFEQHFTQYVMNVQDTCIDLELSYMLTHNVLSVDLIDRAITSSIKE